MKLPAGQSRCLPYDGLHRRRVKKMHIDDLQPPEAQNMAGKALNDKSELKKIFHSIKGSAANLGIEALYQLASEAEGMVKSSETG